MAGLLPNTLIGGGFLISDIKNQRSYIIPDDPNQQESDYDSEYEITFKNNNNDEEAFFIIFKNIFEAAENIKNSK